MSLRSTRRSMLNHYLLHSSSATKFGSSPWHKYSSQSEADPQSFRSRKISSVKVDPDDPINTLDIAQIVLSSIASTFMKEMSRQIRACKTNKQNARKIKKSRLHFTGFSFCVACPPVRNNNMSYRKTILFISYMNLVLLPISSLRSYIQLMVETVQSKRRNMWCLDVRINPLCLKYEKSSRIHRLEQINFVPITRKCRYH